MKFSDLLNSDDIGKTVSDEIIKDVKEGLGGSFVGNMVLDYITESREKEITMSSYSKNNKGCATCEFWGGNRKPSGSSAEVGSSSAKGKCYLKGGPQYNSDMSPEGSCNKWKEWAQL